MYPQGELNELAGTKAALRASIAEHRAACASHAAHILRPLKWIDLAIDLWRQTPLLGKLAAIPLGFFAARSAGRNAKPLGRWLQWGSFIYGVVRQFTGKQSY